MYRSTVHLQSIPCITFKCLGTSRASNHLQTALSALLSPQSCTSFYAWKFSLKTSAFSPGLEMLISLPKNGHGRPRSWPYLKTAHHCVLWGLVPTKPAPHISSLLFIPRRACVFQNQTLVLGLLCSYGKFQSEFFTWHAFKKVLIVTENALLKKDFHMVHLVINSAIQSSDYETKTPKIKIEAQLPGHNLISEIIL